MNEADLLAFLTEEETRSYDGSLLEEVEAALNSYNGALYGDEEEGRSQVVSRDVAEVVDHMTVALLKCFVSGDRVVELEPADPGQEQQADDATEALSADMRKNSYRLIHDWIKAGLLEKIGVVKSCVEKPKKRVEAMYHPAMMPDDAIEAEETDEPHPADGSPMIRAVTLQESVAKFKDYNVPLEEFRFSPDARDFDCAVYLAHIVQKSISDLVEMGFDRELVDTVQGSNPNSGSLAYARNDNRSTMGLDRQGALRQVWLNEEYVLFDLDGDGIAERLCIHRVGNTILNVEACDYQPFEYWTPFPMPSRLVGGSLADKVNDIQRVNTVLERNMLDSLYFQTAPGTYIHEDSCGDHTIDDLLTVRPGRLVRFKGSLPPVPEERQDVSGIAMQAIEFKIGQRESRTGITRMNQGLDADTLNKTATGTAMMQAQGQQIEEYLARNFAESLSRLFRRKLKMMSRYAQPFQIRVDGEFRQVDPSQWGDDMDVVIRVGLGTGRKDQRIAYRQMIVEMQSQALAAGLPIVTPETLYNSGAGLVKDAGLGSPNDFFVKPPPPQMDEQGNPVQPPQQPDPEAMKSQAQMQLLQTQTQTLQEKHQADMQISAATLQSNQQDAALRIELERAKAEAAAKLASDKAGFERQQAVEQMAFEREMRLREFDHQTSIAKYKVDQETEVKKYREGGRLDA